MLWLRNCVIPCDLLKATTFKALSVVNYFNVLMPPSLRFSIICTYHFFGNGGGTPEHRYVECSPSKPEGSDEVNMFNNCHTTMTDIVQCF